MLFFMNINVYEYIIINTDKFKALTKKFSTFIFKASQMKKIVNKEISL